MERIEGAVRKELGRFGPVGSIGRIAEVWAEAVGESIARNAWPARIARDGTLHVHASSAAWAFELTQLAPPILDRLREAAGEAAPKSLRFAPGLLPEPAPDEFEEQQSRPVRASAEARAEAARLAGEIADEDLRKLVERAVAASLARPAADRTF